MANHVYLALLLLLNTVTFICSDHTLASAERERCQSTNHRFEARAKATNADSLSG